jgi:hypothetical protein
MINDSISSDIVIGRKFPSREDRISKTSALLALATLLHGHAFFVESQARNEAP